MFRNLLFFISEALIGMKRSRLMQAAAIAIITVSLLIFGIFLLFTANLNHLAGYVSSKLEIRLFLYPNLSRKDIAEFEKFISQNEHVQNIIFINKEEAWKQFKINFPNLNLENWTEENPLPDSFRVFVKETHAIPQLIQYFSSFSTIVEEAVHKSELAERIEQFSSISRIIGFSMVGLFTFTMLLIIVNTIRLTVIARQEEISIMQLVGATPSFIKGPFLVEGLLIGLTGALLSVLFLKYGYGFFLNHFGERFPYIPLMSDSWTTTIIFTWVIGLGAFLGWLGAYLSISKTLKTTLYK